MSYLLSHFRLRMVPIINDQTNVTICFRKTVELIIEQCDYDKIAMGMEITVSGARSFKSPASERH